MKKLLGNFDGCVPIRAPLAALLLFELCALILRSFAFVKSRDAGLDPLLTHNLSRLVVPLVIGFLMAPIIYKNRSALREQLSFSPLTAKILLGSVLLGMTLRASWWITQLFPIIRYSSLPSELYFQCPDIVALAFTIFVLAVSTPIIEEVVMRGFVLRVLMPRGPVFAVATSSLLFGLMHRPDFIPYAIVAGVFFALLYLRVRNLWAPILAHATINLLSIFDQICLAPIRAAS